MTIYVLNTPILTEYGIYRFIPISLENASHLLAKGFTSAIGHEATANFMSSLFKMKIPMNRVAIHMQPNDMAIVFRLLDRLPEGMILSSEEMKVVKYEIGFLAREA